MKAFHEMDKRPSPTKSYLQKGWSGFLEMLKDALDDVRTLHIYIDEEQLNTIYERISPDTKTFVLNLEIHDRVLGTWYNLFCKPLDGFIYSHILSDDDVRRSTRDGDILASSGYLLRVPVDYKAIARMWHTNAMRVENVLPVGLKFRSLCICWKARGKPNAWRAGTVIMVRASSRAEAEEKLAWLDSLPTSTAWRQPTTLEEVGEKDQSPSSSSECGTQSSASEQLIEKDLTLSYEAKKQTSAPERLIKRKPLPPSAERTESSAQAAKQPYFALTISRR
jgi:hypothetical protein